MRGPNVEESQPLEALLRSGDGVRYGQICWSIGNRGTGLPTLGEVITLGYSATAWEGRY